MDKQIPHGWENGDKGTTEPGSKTTMNEKEKVAAVPGEIKVRDNYVFGANYLGDKLTFKQLAEIQAFREVFGTMPT